MDYDSRNKTLAVFGDHKNINHVWLYQPGPRAGSPGSWRKQQPGGDPVPRDQHFPVAYDSHQGVFLIMPDNSDPDNRHKALSSSTFVYDVASNRYTRLPDADMAPQKMNYMMVYDNQRQVFFLVTGRGNEVPTVWVLRLDLDQLDHG